MSAARKAPLLLIASCLLLLSPAATAAPVGRQVLRRLFEQAGPRPHADTARCTWVQRGFERLDATLGLYRELPSHVRVEVSGRHWGNFTTATEIVIHAEKAASPVLWLRAKQAPSRKAPAVGAEVALFIEQGKQRHPVFCGRVAAASVTSAASDLTLYAPTPSATGRKSRSFEDMRSSDVVASIASELGLTSDVGATEMQAHVSQFQQADWDFMRQLAEQSTHRLWLDGSTIHFKSGGFVAPRARHTSRIYRDLSLVDLISLVAGELGLQTDIQIPPGNIEASVHQNNTEPLYFLREHCKSRNADCRLGPGKQLRATTNQELTSPARSHRVYRIRLGPSQPQYAERAIRVDTKKARLTEATLATPPASAKLGKVTGPWSITQSPPTSAATSKRLVKLIDRAESASSNDAATAFLADEAHRYLDALSTAFTLNPNGQQALQRLEASLPATVKPPTPRNPKPRPLSR